MYRIKRLSCPIAPWYESQTMVEYIMVFSIALNDYTTIELRSRAYGSRGGRAVSILLYLEGADVDSRCICITVLKIDSSTPCQQSLITLDILTWDRHSVVAMFQVPASRHRCKAIPPC